MSFSLASPFTNLRSFFDNSILASIWGLILFGLALLVFFAYYETHISSIPLLPPRLLKNKTIVGGSALGFFHFCSQFCYESFFTSFLQYDARYLPTLSCSADSPFSSTESLEVILLKMLLTSGESPSMFVASRCQS